jgi:hypothetical protein
MDTYASAAEIKSSLLLSFKKEVLSRGGAENCGQASDGDADD